MAQKITSDLLLELRTKEGHFRVSITPNSKKLCDLVRVNRYQGMSHDRIKQIEEETKLALLPICSCLDSYGLVSGKDYVSDIEIRNVSALITRDQVFDLASQEYVGSIGRNLQRNLPF